MRALSLVRFPLDKTVDNDDFCIYPLKFCKLLKDKYNINFDCLSLSKYSSNYSICYDYGADKTYIIEDVKFSGMDTNMTAKILANFISESDINYDIIVSFILSDYGETAHVPSGVASYLDIPFVYAVKQLTDLTGKELLCKYITPSTVVEVRSTYPIVISLHYQFEFPYNISPSLFDVYNAKNKKIINISSAFFKRDFIESIIPKTQITDGKINTIFKQNSLLSKKNAGMQETIDMLSDLILKRDKL